MIRLKTKKVISAFTGGHNFSQLDYDLIGYVFFPLRKVSSCARKEALIACCCNNASRKDLFSALSPLTAFTNGSTNSA